MNLLAQANRTRRLEQRARWALAKHGLNRKAIEDWLDMIESTEGECPELREIMTAEWRLAKARTNPQNQKALVDDSIEFKRELGV